jgi:hypothetical protein
VQLAYILVAEVLEQLQLSVGSLSEDRCAEGLHDLLDGDILVRELVAGRATSIQQSAPARHPGSRHRATYQTRPKAPMPTGWRSEYLLHSRNVSQGSGGCVVAGCTIPGGDLEGRPEDLGADKLGHDDGLCGLTMRGGWR